jgi:bifunctional DNA-binding transcriptional regulator/antitoxin component of YhaV-PrlF toxin-antitoxin module
MKQAVIKIPESLVKKLDLKYGNTVEAKIGKGQLVIFKKEYKPSGFMKFIGIWKDDNVDEVFRDIRKGWRHLAKKLHA